MLNVRTLDGRQLIEQLGIDYFKAGSSFGALSDQAIRFLIEQGVVLQLDKGDKLFSYGGPGDSFYIVLRGRIEYLEPRGNGFIAEVEDYNTLADKIEILLNDDDLKNLLKKSHIKKIWKISLQKNLV
jgi:hypothetical protein